MFLESTNFEKKIILEKMGKQGIRYLKKLLKYVTT
jgi:hypothetical protein